MLVQGVLLFVPGRILQLDEQAELGEGIPLDVVVFAFHSGTGADLVVRGKRADLSADNVKPSSLCGEVLGRYGWGAQA